jgi:sterol desaturase/sphingolipid hydroxylase (fatty acid hydroxylase superfamily)
MRAWLSWLAYPAVMIASTAAAVVGLGRGVPAQVALPAVSIGAAAAIILLEHLIPYQKLWLRSHGDLRTDICHLVISGTATETVRAGMLVGVALGADGLSKTLGATIWPTSWPLALQVVLALVLSELGGYWVHRIQHETRLWRLHAVHHSAPRLYFLNAMRIHPLDMLFGVTLSVLPLALLGAGERVMAVFAVIVSVHMMMQHANIDVRMGWANVIVSMAEVHRWHHSRVVDEANANYGTVLLIWDSVFGTRKVPQDRMPPIDIGLPDMPEFPSGYFAQLASPLNAALWRRSRSE